MTLSSISIKPTYAEQIEELKSVQQQRPNEKVLISGAGTAGLTRAIQCLANGIIPKVIEKRSEQTPGLFNVIKLDRESVRILKTTGVFQRLVEQKRIYNRKDGATVELGDLQKAMKDVVKELGGTIEYGREIEAIDDAGVQIKSASGSQRERFDIVINAEGSRSHTNKLLGNTKKVEVPSIPLVVVVENKKKRSLLSFFWWLICLWLLALRGMISQRGSLETPDHDYVVFALQKGTDAKIDALRKPQADVSEIIEAEETVQTWTGERPYQVADIGAQVAAFFSIRKGNTDVLITGDALVTADPFTARGANDAIQGAVEFEEYLMQRIQDRAEAIGNYNVACGFRVDESVRASRDARLKYRPDTILS